MSARERPARVVRLQYICEAKGCEQPVFPDGLSTPPRRYRYCVKHLCRYEDCGNQSLGAKHDWVCAEHSSAWQLQREEASHRLEIASVDGRLSRKRPRTAGARR